MFIIKLNCGHVSSMKTRNSTRETMYNYINFITRKISSKVVLSIFVPNTQAAFASVLSRRFSDLKLHALGSSVHILMLLQSLLKKKIRA